MAGTYGLAGGTYGLAGGTYGALTVIPPPPPPPPPPFRRWTLYDPYTADLFTFAINPKESGEPTRKKNVSSMLTTAGHIIHHEGARAPQEVTFKGVVLDTTQRDNLDTWTGKPYQVKLTDEHGEVLWVWIDVFTPTRKRVSSRRYKAEYDVHGFVVDIP